jgi:aldose 1-epimerase
MSAHLRHNEGVITLQSPHRIVTALVYPEFGARIGSLIVGDQEIFITQAENGDPLSWGCYPMVPFAGRVRDASLHFAGEHYSLRQNMAPHAIHGTVFDRSWEVISSTSSTTVLETELGPEWPFKGIVQHRIEVADNEIALQLTISALQPMPVQVGWHPWFVKPGSSRLHFAAMLPRDSVGISMEQQVPQPSGPVDDCFIHPEKPLTITIGNVQAKLASDCSHWVLYDMPAHATCIEPQSGPPNSINDRPFVLPAGSTLTKNFTINLQQIT